MLNKGPREYDYPREYLNEDGSVSIAHSFTDDEGSWVAIHDEDDSYDCEECDEDDDDDNWSNHSDDDYWESSW